MNNELQIDAIVINGMSYIPYKKFINVSTQTDELELVYSIKNEKIKMRNRQYYKDNKSKWVLYNENKKKKHLNEQTVIEFY
tara:strand:- start:3510 stop:3752 length:243 start_codon:yes stop_codon:yes gene_type:complete